MTKLLCALDMAVNTNDEAVAAAVLDKSHKTYMAQLVEVRKQQKLTFRRHCHCRSLQLSQNCRIIKVLNEKYEFWDGLKMKD